MSTKSVNINAILAAPEHSRSSPRGAPMGASDYMDAPESKLHLQRIRFVDGDYGPDGTYWGGGGPPLWCAFTTEAPWPHVLVNCVYVRAKDRAAAVAEVRTLYPGARFIREL